MIYKTRRSAFLKPSPLRLLAEYDNQECKVLGLTTDDELPEFMIEFPDGFIGGAHEQELFADPKALDYAELDYLSSLKPETCSFCASGYSHQPKAKPKAVKEYTGTKIIDNNDLTIAEVVGKVGKNV